jgi:hypothetical protein
VSDKTKKSTKKDKSAKGKSADKSAKKNKKSKAERQKEREAKKEARKGDGSFPDILIITREKNGDGKKFFAAHNGETMDTLYDNDQVVGVYKLRRVSKMVINRKVAR